MKSSGVQHIKTWLVGGFTLAGIVALSACTGTANDSGTSAPTSPSSGGATSSSASPTSPSSTTAPKPSNTTPAPKLDKESAVTSISEALEAVSKALNDPEADPDLSTIASGSYLDSVKALNDQFVTEGLLQEGESRIEDVVVLEQLDDGKVRVQACVDSSDVRILDENGVDRRGAGTIDRSLTIFTLESAEGRWMISDETAGEPAEC